MDEAADLLTAEGRDGWMQVIESLMRKAIGTKAIRQGEAGPEVVYDVLPDVRAAQLLLEHRFGRPKQQLEVIDPNEQFKGLPQLILCPPKGYKGPLPK